MTRIRAALQVAVMTAAVLAPGYALAQTVVPAPRQQAPPPQCDKRDDVLQVLKQKYKESPVALGVTHNGGLVEVLTSPGGATWSILVTTPQGVSCLVAAGEGWRVSPAQENKDPGA